MHELQSIAHDYPDSPIPAMREGDMLRGKQRFAEAIAVYDRPSLGSKTQAPADWLVYYDRGICYERSHQWTRAEADFKHALKISPDEPYVLNYLGYSWADMGQNLAQAREMIEKAVQRRPNDGAIVDSLGWVMLRQGQVDRRGEHVGARGRTGSRGFVHQRPSRRCLLGGGAEAGGGLSVAPRADLQSRAGRCGEVGGEAAGRPATDPGQRPVALCLIA